MGKEQNLFGNLLNFKSLLMPRNTILIIVMALLAVSVNAQGQGKKKKKVVPQPKISSELMVSSEFIESIELGCVPTQRDSMTTVEINKASNGSLTFKTNESSSDSLDKILSNIKGKSVITIKADSSMDFGSVAKALYETRRITNDCVNIEASTNSKKPYVYYLPEPIRDQSANVKPNPLTLKIFITSDRKVMLNKEKPVSLDNVSQITKQLNEIFKYRTNNGVYRERTNIIETSVIVKPTRSVKFSDVIKVIDALKETEASPIGLVIDDLQP